MPYQKQNTKNNRNKRDGKQCADSNDCSPGKTYCTSIHGCQPCPTKGLPQGANCAGQQDGKCSTVCGQGLKCITDPNQTMSGPSCQPQSK